MHENLLKNIELFNMRTIYLFILLNIVYPCAVCFGDPNHPVTEGINNAILFMLFITVCVLSCIATSIYILMQRAKKIEVIRRVDDR